MLKYTVRRARLVALLTGLIVAVIAHAAYAFEGVWQTDQDTLRLHQIGPYIIGDAGPDSVMVGRITDGCLVGRVIGLAGEVNIALQRVGDRLKGRFETIDGREIHVDARRSSTNVTAFRNFRRDGQESPLIPNARTVFDGSYTSPFGSITLYVRDNLLIGDYGPTGLLAGAWDGNSFQGYFVNSSGATGWFDFAFFSRNGAFRSGEWGAGGERRGHWTLTRRSSSAGQPQNMRTSIDCEPGGPDPARPDPQPEPTPAWSYSQPNDLDLTYRDLGVLIHHTRIPFRTSPARFTQSVARDPNWTGAQILQSNTRMAASNGSLISSAILPPDVVMSVIRPQSAAGSTCVVSYRGTDREDLTHPELAGDIHEGLIATNVLSETMNGQGPSCLVKNAYLRNYGETRTRVMEFLRDVTNRGECTRGLVVTGMSLGGATANLAFADLVMVRQGIAPRGIQQLVDANKVWLRTVGAPRSLSAQCAADLQNLAGDQVERFLYGSLSLENQAQASSARNCARFVDPVPGNPYSVITSATTSARMSHFGRAIVGHNVLPNTTNPSTPTLSAANQALCSNLDRCHSIRFANAHARVATRFANFAFPAASDYPRYRVDSGGACSAPGLIPAREYMFGRLHDTCSYRNLLAVYGQRHNGEPQGTNHICPMPPSRGDPQSYPKEVCPIGRTVLGRQICATNPINVTQFHQP
ncbi:MAG: hypothetical protein AAF709_15295 [Pseudomonadota bacterium]